MMIPNLNESEELILRICATAAGNISPVTIAIMCDAPIDLHTIERMLEKFVGMRYLTRTEPNTYKPNLTNKTIIEIRKGEI